MCIYICAALRGQWSDGFVHCFHVFNLNGKPNGAGGVSRESRKYYMAVGPTDPFRTGSLSGVKKASASLDHSYSKRLSRLSFSGSSLLGARTLLGAPGLATRNKKLLGAKGIATNGARTLLGAPSARSVATLLCDQLVAHFCDLAEPVRPRPSRFNTYHYHPVFVVHRCASIAITCHQRQLRFHTF